MTDFAFFKVKNSKRSNPEARTTLDAIHNQKVNEYLEQKDNLSSYKQDLDTLKERIKNTTCDIEIWRLEKDAELLEKKIKSLNDGSEIMDYYLRAGDILYNYYDIQEQIQHGSKAYTSTKAKPGSILAILEGVAQEEQQEKEQQEQQGKHGKQAQQEKQGKQAQQEKQPIQENQDATLPIQKGRQRNQLLNDYLQIENPSMARNNVEEYDDPWTLCDICENEMKMCLNEANLTCSKCGHQEFILVDSDKPSYKDPPREVCYYAYKKINHFNEWLAQFQAKESTEIPSEIYDTILIQLKKERITNMASLKPTKLREILRKMKASKYYEHIPHIINRLNGQNAPCMSREDEEKLRHMFREIQPSFKKHCPKGRRNFLSYGYVLYKMCELLEMDEYLPCFPLLKNRDKLYLQDKTWEKICFEMGWQYISTA